MVPQVRARLLGANLGSRYMPSPGYPSCKAAVADLYSAWTLQLSSEVVAFAIVILSAAGSSRSELPAESKDPYSTKNVGRE